MAAADPGAGLAAHSRAGQEIERKFLVDPAALPGELNTFPHQEVEQGYLAAEPDGNEVRLRRAGGRHRLTVKNQGGLVRQECEVELRAEDFAALWPMAQARSLRKTRFRVPVSEHLVEVDVYAGVLAGLVTAEVEFASSAASQAFVPPPWLGREITDDRRYRNECLASCGLPAPAARSQPPTVTEIRHHAHADGHHHGP